MYVVGGGVRKLEARVRPFELFILRRRRSEKERKKDFYYSFYYE